MNALPDKAVQGLVDHAVLFNARFPAKRLSADFHQKVAFTLCVSPAMARMMVRLVDHLQMDWRKSA